MCYFCCPPHVGRKLKRKVRDIVTTNPRQQFEKDMKSMLKRIEQNDDMSNLTQYELHILEECLNRKYVSGPTIQRTVSGRLISKMPSKLIIEKAGLDFLYPSIDWIAIITMIASIITALATAAALLK